MTSKKLVHSNLQGDQLFPYYNTMTGENRPQIKEFDTWGLDNNIFYQQDWHLYIREDLDFIAAQNAKSNYVEYVKSQKLAIRSFDTKQKQIQKSLLESWQKGNKRI